MTLLEELEEQMRKRLQSAGFTTSMAAVMVKAAIQEPKAKLTELETLQKDPKVMRYLGLEAEIHTLRQSWQQPEDAVSVDFDKQLAYRVCREHDGETVNRFVLSKVLLKAGVFSEDTPPYVRQRRIRYLKQAGYLAVVELDIRNNANKYRFTPPVREAVVPDDPEEMRKAGLI